MSSIASRVGSRTPRGSRAGGTAALHGGCGSSAKTAVELSYSSEEDDVIEIVNPENLPCQDPAQEVPEFALNVAPDREASEDTTGTAESHDGMYFI